AVFLPLDPDAPHPLLAVGDYVPSFQVRDVTGPNAVRQVCYRCQYGVRPTTAVFTRSVTPGLVRLVHGLERRLRADDAKCGFVVLLTDERDAGARELERLARFQRLRRLPLTLFQNTAGPPAFGLHADALHTILLWSRVQVDAVYAVRDDLSRPTVDRLLAGVDALT
ncbi:MAG: hypothetical protein ACRDD1_12000, partial [Planctomycetia bacterium]